MVPFSQEAASFLYIKKSDRVNAAECACYVKRNYWMVDDSNYAYFFLNKKTGGVALINNYAKKKSRDSIYDICNLVENEKNLYLLVLR